MVHASKARLLGLSPITLAEATGEIKRLGGSVVYKSTPALLDNTAEG